MHLPFLGKVSETQLGSSGCLLLASSEGWWSAWPPSGSILEYEVIEIVILKLFVMMLPHNGYR